MIHPGTQLVITRGLPASGKTSWAKTWVAEDPNNRARVGRDDLRAMMQPEPPTFEYAREEVISAAQQATVRALLRRGTSVVIDDLNLRLKYARAWADMAFTTSVEFMVVDFDTDLEQCVLWDAARGDRGERRVGESVIREIAARFHGPRQDVRRTGPTPPAFPNYVPDPLLPRAVLVDIDGTVATMGDRSPYDYGSVSVDTPNEAVIRVVEALSIVGYKIVFLSGREDSCRDDTIKWLADHVPVPVDRLVMRKTGDHRNDAIVKIEMFEEHVAPYYHVVCALDDRNRVVAAWRAHGITCLQVQDGDF